MSKGALVAAVEAGHCTLKSLCDATRAGTGCGSCKTQVQQVLELAAGDADADRPVRALLRAGRAAEQAGPRDGGARARPAQRVRGVRRAGRRARGRRRARRGSRRCCKTIWGKEYDDERDARFINDRVHANIQKDGTFTVVPRIYGGVTTAAELRRIADVAEKYDVPMVKITGGQRIDLLGMKKEELPDVWRDLGMPSGHAYTKAFRTCKTCVGSEFCRYGVGDSTALGMQIEQRFQGFESPAKVKLATAGCPRNCSEATTKDVGAVAIEGGEWEIYVGGAAGARVRKGDVLCVVDSHDDVLQHIGRFMQYYREHAKYLERTYDFVPRIGIEKLRSILVDDSEGICARLDAAMEAAVDAYVDPWQEAVDAGASVAVRRRAGAGRRGGRRHDRPRARVPLDARRGTTTSGPSTASRRARGRPSRRGDARSPCSARAAPTKCTPRRRAARTRRGCSPTGSSATAR